MHILYHYEFGRGAIMRQITSTELACMEVINLCDGGRLGYPTSVELDADNGHITALIIPRETGFFSLGRSEVYRVPWCRIECLGEDAILVKLSAAELSNCVIKPCKKKR